VDTHKDSHTAAAVDSAGRTLGVAQFPTTPAGYAALLSWLRSFGTLVLVGIEGTGVYGAGLALHLHTAGVALVEIDRPDRKARRWPGKSDPVDAEAAARAALVGRRTGVPKRRDGQVEALRVLRVAQRSAVAQRADAQRRLKALLVTAPDELRAQLRGLGTRELVRTCAAARPDRTRAGDPTSASPIGAPATRWSCRFGPARAGWVTSRPPPVRANLERPRSSSVVTSRPRAEPVPPPVAVPTAPVPVEISDDT
jgi:hypothetical protein